MVLMDHKASFGLIIVFMCSLQNRTVHIIAKKKSSRLSKKIHGNHFSSFSAKRTIVLTNENTYF